ncbi:MAG: ATP-binding cassette domain-containing protein [Puniceicoccales bacterium]|nr:ATP-binding cassette domain-containing protein [Puniceicoccales bacterium]
MYHSPIHIKSFCLSFSHKICFEDFSATIEYGSRITIIGRNGSGKSMLLKILRGSFEPYRGSVTIPENAVIGYVPQIVEDFETLSGGQRLNKSLTQALSADPNILLLDEPTNHLDIPNRQSLMRMLRSYEGTLIVVSHDIEFLCSCVDHYGISTVGKSMCSREIMMITWKVSE